jgi:hypothetical protein
MAAVVGGTVEKASAAVTADNVKQPPAVLLSRLFSDVPGSPFLPALLGGRKWSSSFVF